MISDRFARIATALLATWITGCSVDVSGPGIPKDNGKPEERWQKIGTFKYDFTEIVNGSVVCQTREIFTRESDYCTTLKDSEKNDACAREQREALYRNECGADFEETNIRPVQFSGFDERLQRSCYTSSGPIRFEKASEYCAFLKDEAKHSSCHWEKRGQEFRRNDCAGDFSQPPAIVTPPVNPPPPPPVNPVPHGPKIVAELEAAGIHVNTNYNGSGHTLPGEASFHEKRERFYKTLEFAKNDILAFRPELKEIALVERTKYYTGGGRLNIDVGMDLQTLRAYLELLKRRIAWEKNTKIQLDLGIEIYGHLGDDKELSELAEKIAWFEAQAAKLVLLGGVVKIIEIGDYTSYSDYNKTLKIDKDNYQSEILRYHKVLKDAGQFMRFAEANDIEVKLDLDDDTDFANFGSLAQELYQKREALKMLRTEGVIDSIEFSKYRDETNHIGETFSPATVGEGRKIVGKVVDALEARVLIAKRLGKKVEYSDYKLTDEFVESISRLQKRESVIAKKTKINRISFMSNSSFSGSTLYIGHEDKLSDLDKVLASIQ